MFSRILLRIERFIGVRLDYFIQGGIWITLGKLFASGIAFIISLALARYVTKETYGNYRYILSALSIFGGLALPGMSTAITRSVARGFPGTFRKGGRLIFLFTFGITLCGLIYAWITYTQGKTMLALGLVIGSVLVPFSEGLGNWRAYYDGRKDFKTKTILNIVDYIFYGICICGAIAATYLLGTPSEITLLILLTAYFVGEGLPNLYFFIHTFRSIPKHAPAEPGSISFGIHGSIALIPTSVAFYIDALILHTYFGPQSVALYSFAMALPEQMKSFMLSAVDMAFPKLAEQIKTEHDRNRLKKTLTPIILKACLITASIVALYITAAPFIYSTLFPKYVDSIHYSQFFALGLVLMPFSILDSTLKAEANIKKTYILNIVSPLVQIISFALLIPLFGVWGAIMGKVSGKLLNYAVLYILFRA